MTPAKAKRPSDAGGTTRGEGGDALVSVFVGLGANLGDPRATLELALAGLRDIARAEPTFDPDSFRPSSFYRSAPVDAIGPEFLNAVVRFDTSLSPLALLDALQAIERRFGRERPYRNAPRTLDLDVLLYAVDAASGGLRLAGDRLEIPHPRAAQRAFVLEPLAELWPEGEIPGAGRVADLLQRARLDASQRVERLAG